MRNLLYIGNNLNSANSNISSIATLGPLLESAGFQLRYASSKESQFWRLWDMVVTLLRYYQQMDVVIIDTYSTRNFYYAVIISQLCRLLGRPYIPSLNGGNLPERLERSPIMSRMLFKHAYKLVSPSIYLKEAFEHRGFQKVYFVPNTIQIENYPYQERDFKTLRLLWVRSFSVIYNPQLAVRLLKALQDDGLDVQLCMVGPDSDGSLKKVQQLADDLGVSVQFTGKLTKAEWTALAAEYNVFVNTTNFDNMPVSVIEAMALGLPIVSTRVGGMPYLIADGEDGLLVPPDDVEALVTAVKRVMHHPIASRAMAFNARQKVEQFDWEVVKQSWFTVLDKG